MTNLIKISSWVEKHRPRPTSRPAPKKKGSPRLTPAVKMLRRLDRDADVFAASMLWLGNIAKRGHDVRALVAFTSEHIEDYFDDIDLSLEFVEAFRREWRRRLARRSKPRPVR